MFANMASLPGSFVLRPQSPPSTDTVIYPSSSSISLRVLLTTVVSSRTSFLEMSASLWDWPLASADGQPLNVDECFLLLDTEFSDDLLKTFPAAAPKVESSLVEYQLSDDATSSLYPPSPPDTKPTRAKLASDLLQQLDNNDCKQENLFSNWLEEKVELPIFDGITQVHEHVDAPQPSPAAGLFAVPVPAPVLAYGVAQPTEDLLREFETVYGAVELTHLTPPQSPPGPATQLLLSYAHQAQCAPQAPPFAAPQPDAWHPGSTPAPSDIELQTVEELFSREASPRPSSGSASPRSSPPSSPRSSADEDWSAGSSRPKPYSRGGDDRRSRKKEQNKNAATRYRQKKKAEIEVLLSEEHALRQLHSELGTKRADLQREISYLKGLMRELFKAKGLIK